MSRFVPECNVFGEFLRWGVLMGLVVCERDVCGFIWHWLHLNLVVLTVALVRHFAREDGKKPVPTYLWSGGEGFGGVLAGEGIFLIFI
jgi:hypothetical protein